MSTELAMIDNITMIPFAAQKQRLDELGKFMKGILVTNKDLSKADYGIIPGTNKPTLLKSGAEKLCFAFNLSPQISTTKEIMENGHREYISKCTLIHINTGKCVGVAEGSCCTMEKKYRFEYGNETQNIADKYNTCLKMASKRALVAAVLIGTGASSIFTQDTEEIQQNSNQNQPSNNGNDNNQYDNKTCPICGENTLGKSQFDYDGKPAYYCYPNKGGCKFKITVAEFENKSVEPVDINNTTGEYVTDQSPEPQEPSY